MSTRPRKRRRTDLEDVIGSWSKHDPITVRMACENFCIFGKTGSGKSSGSGDYLLRCLVACDSGGVLLASKLEDKRYIQRVFREAGRLGDLRVMEPGGDYRFNVLDYEMRRGANTQQLTQLLMILGETLDRLEGAGQGEGRFWKSKNREGLNHAIEIVTRARGKLDPWELQIFITGAALSLAELGDPEWQGSFHNQCLIDAKRHCTTDIQRHDHQAAEHHWRSTWPRLNNETRSSVEAGLMSLMHVLNTGVIRDLLATTTNIKPDDLEHRVWWLVNAPIVPGDATNTMLNATVKLAVQRYILRREAGAGDPLLVIFGDEFTKITNSYDAAFLSENRSHKSSLVALTQGVSGMYANMNETKGEHIANAFLSQFGQVVFHTSDPKTAQFGSDMLGQRLEMMPGGSPTQPRDNFELLMSRAQFMPNFNYHYQPILQPTLFMSGLRSGGPANGNVVDGIVVRPGMPFNASGENYLLTSFIQR